MRSLICTVIALATAVGCGVQTGDVQLVPVPREYRFGIRTVPPAESVSPSGGYAIKVITSSRRANGPATYRLTRGDKVEWEKEMPFSLVKVWINDEGTFGGYAYTYGREGFGRAEPGDQSLGELILAIIDRSGTIVDSRTFVREHTGFLHDSPHPVVGESSVFGGNEAALLEVSESSKHPEAGGFWKLDFKSKVLTKAKVPYQVPDDVGSSYLMAMYAVPGTELVLGQWYEYRSMTSLGTRFVLFDANGREDWSQAWPDDYSNPIDDDGVQDAIDRVRGDGAIVALGPSRFMLRSIASDSLIEYEVRDGHVREVRRRKYDEALLPKPRRNYVDWGNVAARSLEVLASFEVGHAPTVTEGAVEALEGANATYVLLIERDEWFGLLQIDLDGNVVGSLRLDASGVTDEHQLTACRISDSQYAIAVSKYDPAFTTIWIADLGKGSQMKRAELKGVQVERMSSENGSVFVLGEVPSRYSSAEYLACIDRAGRVTWAIEQNGYSNAPEELFAVEDVEVVKGEVFVLSNIAHNVKVYGASNGRHRRTYDLESLWGYEPSYPTDIVAERGGFVIRDFSSEAEIVHVGGDFKIRSKYNQRFNDGRSFHIYDGPKVGSTGKVYMLGETALHELDATGNVVRSIGRQAPKAGLTEIFDVSTNGKGLIYASDAQTGSVYSFDSDLRLATEFKVRPEDFPDYPANAWFNVSDTGHVYVASFYMEMFVEFAPDGKRLGNRSMKPLDDFEGPEQLVPKERKSGTRWFREKLLDRDSNVLASIGRRFDEHWLGGSLVEAPDGSFLTIDTDDETHVFSFHARNGTALSMMKFEAPTKGMMSTAYDGTLVYVADDESLSAFDKSGRPVWRAPWPEEVKSVRLAGVLDDGRLVAWTAQTIRVLQVKSPTSRSPSGSRCRSPSRGRRPPRRPA